MMRIIALLALPLTFSACAYTTSLDDEKLEYRRVDYYETVFLPASTACLRAGGFMIYEDAAHTSARKAALSYGDMRLAVARGCAGI